MNRYINADILIAELISKDFLPAIVKRAIENVPTADVVEIPEGGIGNLSDGYHTFNELYHHRAILFSVICNSMPDKAWKSKLHDTGDMYDGMFIVGIETPEGQATYHYDIEPYWGIFKVKEIAKAPKWDGHTPQVAIDRIFKISADLVESYRQELAKERADTVKKLSKKLINHFDECGAFTDMETDFIALEIDNVAEEFLRGR